MAQLTGSIYEERAALRATLAETKRLLALPRTVGLRRVIGSRVSAA